MMNILQKIGKRQTILISISIILVDLYSIYFYNSVLPETGNNKIVQQVIRFLLTIALLYVAYKGKNWARIVLIILCSFAIPLAILSVLVTKADILLKIPFFVMIIVYSIALYHYGFSKNYKAFAAYENGKSDG